MAQILVFGDSIAHGFIDERGGWVDRLRQHFYQTRLANSQFKDPGVFNLAVDGDTAEGVAMRIKNEIKAREFPWSGPSDICIIAIGANDSRADGEPNSYISSPDNYRTQLALIYDVITGFQKKCLFIGLMPVLDSITQPVSWGSHFYTNERILAFDQVQADFCNEHTIPRVELYEAIQSHPNIEQLLYYGVHPNSAGHAWMYAQIKPHVLSLLEKQ